VATPVLVTAGLSVGLAACSSSPDAAAYGRQACQHVARSLALFQQSETAPASEAAGLRARALEQLRDALQPASLANATSGVWQPLMATLSESSRVPEADLVKALRQQCAADLG
jgi:hypothetical protein